MEFYMDEKLTVNTKIDNNITIKIDCYFENENPHESSTFKAIVFLLIDGEEQKHKEYSNIDDLFSDLIEVLSTEKTIDLIQENFNEFDKEATKSWRQEEWDREGAEELKDLEREYWSTR